MENVGICTTEVLQDVMNGLKWVMLYSLMLGYVLVITAV